MQIDRERISTLIQNLFLITDELEAMTKRKFTLDGHLVGSMGEVLASAIFDIELLPHSTKGRDARKGDSSVEVKATFGRSVSFRNHDVENDVDRCLVLKLSRTSPHLERVVYNGGIRPIRDALSGRAMPSNGQKKISLRQLEKLDARVAENDRLLRTTGVLI